MTSYRVNRSNGALTKVGTVLAASGPDGIIPEWSGHYVYVINFTSDDVSGYAINTETGQLSAVPGSPFTAGSQPTSIGATGKVVYALNSGAGTSSGYTISASTGALTGAPGSPFLMPECCVFPNMTDLDPIHNLLFHSAIGFTAGTDNIRSYNIQSNGAISGGSETGGVNGPEAVALDPSYQFVYATEIDGNTGQPEVVSIKYSPSDGSGSIFSGPLARPKATPNQIAVSR